VHFTPPHPTSPHLTPPHLTPPHPTPPHLTPPHLTSPHTPSATTLLPQDPSKHQKIISSVLGIPMHKIVSKTKRLGGGFGGKETRAIPWNCVAAVAAYNSKRAVRLVLDRDEDMQMTGERGAGGWGWGQGCGVMYKQACSYLSPACISMLLPLCQRCSMNHVCQATCRRTPSGTRPALHGTCTPPS
jgi:hypothetical protein